MLTQRLPVEDGHPRCIVDYALARRSALVALRTGRIRREDACDAQTYLRRAARFHGVPSAEPCPVCRDPQMLDVAYAYGECLGGDGSGRARARKELAELATSMPEFSVYVVEVCLGCGWNHLVTSYVLGTGQPAARRRRVRT